MNSTYKIRPQPKGQPGRADGQALQAALQASAVWLEAHFKIVNEQNVFPVPDGDTGTNMVLTMRAVVEEVAALSTNPAVTDVAAAAAKGALFGARGNSGIILSQFLRGFADVLAGEQTLRAVKLAEAVSHGAKSAVACVARPVEGTLLTVLCAAADAAQAQQPLKGGVTKLVAGMLAAARLAQAKTPDLLPVLKEAGVTDSGGLGFVYLLEGVWRWLNGQSLVPDEVSQTGWLTNGHRRRPATLPSTVDKSYGYDVQFLLHKATADISTVRAMLERLGWSVLVVGQADTLKVHLHTGDPAQAVATSGSLGIVDHIAVEDMQQQAHAFTAGSRINNQAGQVSTVAVVEGAGFVRLFQSLGANFMLSGARGTAPEVEAFLLAINQVPGAEVVVLPNSAAALISANEAQARAAKRVGVVPTRSMPQGLAALLAAQQQTDWAATIEQMAENAEAVQILVLRPATHEEHPEWPGQIVGVRPEAPAIVGPTSHAVVLEWLSEVRLENFELITLYFGQDVTAESAAEVAQQIARRLPLLEVELHPGGQPDSYYIVALE